MNIPENIKNEIEKCLSRKNVYFGNFSSELKEFLNREYYYLFSIRAQWHMLSNNLVELPLCAYPSCTNVVKWNEGKKRFDDGCCLDHNKKITFLKNFGVDHPNKSKKHQRKVIKSMREKFGVDYITQTEYHKEKVKKTNLEKYNAESVLKVPEIREKIKSTNVIKFGYSECLSSPKIREKASKTNFKKFGFECSLSSPKIREKASKTNIERYGSIFPMRNEELLEKRRLTIVEKYDVNGILAFEEISQKVRKKHFKRFYESKLMNNDFVLPLFSLDEYRGTKAVKDYLWLCKKCNNEFVDNVDNGHMPRCSFCFPKDSRVSNAETELFESISYENKIQTNRGLIDGYEIDIYFPDKKIGVEFNGMYWHSEQKGIDKFYHLDKTINAENFGIFLIHIFEVEWRLRRKQIVSFIEKQLGIGYHILDTECLIIKEISEFLANAFIEENSFYLFGSYSEKRLGAFYGDELVAIMTFKIFKNKIVIMKFFEKNNVLFNNVFEKLLNYFNFSKPIFYYPDRRFNRIDNVTLLSAGFTFEGGTEPDLLYNKKNIFLPTHCISEKNIVKYVNNYDKKISIRENLILNGYFSIWDCGKLVFKKS